MRKARLTLVGAGPGDPDLITVRGIKALADADVVLYDALTHPDLLKYAPARAEKVFVGKRAGNCKYKQDEINNLIVDYALQFGHVVRLKGGDPFIFGRGHEETEYARSFNIESEVIPGITSAISVPELQRVPLTRRGVSESFWVITGTTRNHDFSRDIILAAQSSATVVVLMGMNNLSRICNEFRKAGKEDTPVAVIQNGSLPEEKIGLGFISNITEVVEKEGLSSPAIIVIGNVVRLHPEYVIDYFHQNSAKIEKEGKVAVNSNLNKLYSQLVKWR